MTTIYDKSFNLSDYSGPNNSGLRILKVKEASDGVDVILLESFDMVVYPPKSYGKIKRTYMIYLGDRDTGRCDYWMRFGTKSEALKDMKSH